MKMKKITIYLLLVAGAASVSSCDSFLDKMPDNRAELNNAEKVSQLLVSAYPNATYVQMAELMSDNVTDNGPSYGIYTRSVEDSYLWQNYTDNQQDTPQYLWDGFYKAIAAANHALEFIDKVDDPQEYQAHKGEALICRAYAHFILVNMFSQHYNEATADVDLGIPYVTQPEKIVLGKYDRGTVAGVYANIYRDIEDGLPLINDSKYNKNVLKYHFNQKAAYAFAARFNLYYGNYDKAIEYSTKALGSNPEKVLRDHVPLIQVAATKDYGIAYIKSELPCNLLLMPSYSSWTFNHWVVRNYYRYAHNLKKLEDETLWKSGPWGESDNFYLAHKVYGLDQVTYVPKYGQFIEYTDVVAGTGYLNIVNTVFTTDETLLCRAEAYVHQKNYANAAHDLATWYKARTLPGARALTEERINTYYTTAGDVLCPELNPAFPIADAKQRNFFHCVLHFRRCETLHEGLRWFDIKRFGLQVVHPVSGQPDNVLKVNDLRRAVQIPADVIGAGMVPNPR